MSNAESTFTGKVVGTKRTTTSLNGNPAFYVKLSSRHGDEITVRTQTDSMIGYAIENPEYRKHEHVFKLTRTGRLYGAERVGEA